MTDTISRIALDTAKNSRGDGEIFEHKRYGNGVAGKGKVDFAEEILYHFDHMFTGCDALVVALRH